MSSPTTSLKHLHLRARHGDQVALNELLAQLGRHLPRIVDHSLDSAGEQSQLAENIRATADRVASSRPGAEPLDRSRLVEQVSQRIHAGLRAGVQRVIARERSAMETVRF